MRRTSSLLVALLGVCSLAAPASAEGESPGLLTLDAASASLALATAQPSGTDAELAPGAERRFGEPGVWWGGVGMGAGFGGADNNYDLTGYITLSTFIVESVEFVTEFSGWYFEQQKFDNVGAANFSLLLRWHFLQREDWSLFATAGAGMLMATDEIPEGGTEFNFTPRLEAGATLKLGDGPERLIVGGRWQHISNARISGSGRNPGRDAGVVFVGVQFPF